MANQATSEEGFCLRAFEKAIIDERRVKQMCKDCCEQPKKLKGKPEGCSPDQIK